MALAAAGDGIESAKYLNVYKTLNTINNQVRPIINRSNSAVPTVEDDGFLRIDRPSIKRTSSENPVNAENNLDENHGGVFECKLSKMNDNVFAESLLTM